LAPIKFSARRDLPAVVEDQPGDKSGGKAGNGGLGGEVSGCGAQKEDQEKE
jgi:hypothetical protein